MHLKRRPLPQRLVWPHFVEGHEVRLDLLCELRRIGDLALVEVLVLHRAMEAFHRPVGPPKGLPGAGNILVFDNQGAAGYPPAPRGIPPAVETITQSWARRTFRGRKGIAERAGPE